MTFRHWLRNTKQHLRQSGLRKGGKAAASEFYTGAALRVFKRLPITRGEAVFDRDWDVLLVLDACRVDALREVAPEYDWLPDSIPATRSLGSMSEEWMEENFDGRFGAEKMRTGHVTWNAYSNHNLEASEWAFLDELWRGCWDGDKGCVPPRPVTNRAIQRWRQDDPQRMIVHYMQPHAPYRQLVDDGVVEKLEEEYVGDRDHQNRLTVWKLLRRGEISHERAWNAYIDNLRWVLDDITVLRENLDAADVAITADHGDCFGEWGGLYGHPRGVRAPELVRVPWVKIDAFDVHTHEPAVNVDADGEPDVSASADDRLRALGYK